MSVNKLRHVVGSSWQQAKQIQAAMGNRRLHLAQTQHRQSPVSLRTDLSYAKGPREGELLHMTVGQALDRAADQWGDREGLVVSHQDVRRTFSQIHQEARQLAAGFSSLGLRPGDRLGMWGPNSHEWYLTMFAAALAGLVLVNVNPAYRPRELKYALNKVGVSGMVASERFKSQDYHSILAEVMPEMRDCSPGNIQSKAVPSLRHAIIISEEEKAGAHRFNDVFCGGGSDDYRRIDETSINCFSPYNIQFTSGTTGFPKGVSLSHHNVVNNAFYVGRRVGYDDKQHRLCLPLPLFHCFGQICGGLASVMHGATSIFPCLSFNGEAAVEAMEKEKCTAVYGTPTMFVDMLAAARRTHPDLSNMETGMIAGAPCPQELLKNIISELNMPDLVVVYGLTETSPIVFQGFCSDTMDKKIGTIGFPADHVEVAVFIEGEVVPVGVKGELVTRGYCNMLGYWGDQEKTKQAIDENGWFHTGDEAVMDQSGYGQIVGRIKDLIIRGGENIAPTEVEEFLYTHPAIQEVQVVGVKDERLGEEVAAWVKLNPGFDLSRDDIKAFCKGNLSHFKIPKYILLVESFPVTGSGKIQKFVMREKTLEMVEQQENDVCVAFNLKSCKVFNV